MMRVAVRRQIVVVVMRRSVIMLVAGLGMRTVAVLLDGENGGVAAVTFKATRGLGDMHPSHRQEGDKADGEAGGLHRQVRFSLAGL